MILSESVAIIMILCFVGSLFATDMIVPFVVKLLKKKSIIALEVKNKLFVPKIGGIPLFIMISLSLYIMRDLDKFNIIPSISVCLFILFLVGFRADNSKTNPLILLIPQVICAGILGFEECFQLNLFHHFIKGVTAFEILIPILLILIIVGITYSFSLLNVTEGILTYSILLILISMAIIMWIVHEYFFVGLLVVGMGTIVAFLKYHLSKDYYRINWGKSGVMLFGFLVSISIIRLFSIEVETLRATFLPISNLIVLILAILFFPLTNLIRVYIGRLIYSRQMKSAETIYAMRKISDGFRLSRRMFCFYLMTYCSLIIISFFWLAFFLSAVQLFIFLMAVVLFDSLLLLYLSNRIKRKAISPKIKEQ